MSIRTSAYSSENLQRMNLTVANSPFRVDPNDAPQVPAGDHLPPAPIDPSIDKWFFISVFRSKMPLISGIRVVRIFWRLSS